ncbi:MAG: GNAT family N-acetyltransferase [Planctomycetota bacterium]
MPVVDAVVSCDMPDSFRVQQVAGLFDVPLTARSERRFRVEVPDLDEEWTLGAIVGPSGSGKTTIAREAFSAYLCRSQPWPETAAVIDGFGDVPTRDVVRTLSAVGLASPPAWVRPYRTLSNGERFRCDLARALSANAKLAVVDEFTSVVDRTVGRIGSAAVAKAVRGGRVGARRFVAVSCHYDILEWLAPDWVVDMATGELARGRLQCPPLRLDLDRCTRDTWRLFARHHYLSGTLHPSAQCYVATWAGEPVAFAAVLPVMGRKGFRRISRLVVGPDYQGVGIGGAVIDAVADLYARRGLRVTVTTGHPTLMHVLSRSPRWRFRKLARTGRKGHTAIGHRAITSRGRAVGSFEYRP